MSVTYREVGATLAGQAPTGYRHGVDRVVLGSGDDVFARGRDALRRWETHVGAGIEVLPSLPPLVVDATVLQVLRLGPLSALAACRVVGIVDEPDRFGFAYGTLPLHPERGEEAFLVHRDPDGEVRFEVTSFSRPAHLLSRLGGPITTAVQRAVTRRYLGGVADAVRR